MSDKTKAQKWKQRLKDDCEPIGEPINWSHADTRYFGHIHDLADCGYDRAEEVAASVAALTERVDGMQRELAAHVADLRRHERAGKDRDAYDPDCDCPECTADRARMTPPPPEADAGDAFVDALVRAYVSPGVLYDSKQAHRYREAYVTLTKPLDEDWPEVGEVQHYEMVARAAALPERSAPAPVACPDRREGITKDRLKRLVGAYSHTSGIGIEPGIRAVLQELGYEVTE